MTLPHSIIPAALADYCESVRRVRMAAVLSRWQRGNDSVFESVVVASCEPMDNSKTLLSIVRSTVKDAVKQCGTQMKAAELSDGCGDVGYNVFIRSTRNTDASGSADYRRVQSRACAISSAINVADVGQRSTVLSRSGRRTARHLHEQFHRLNQSLRVDQRPMLRGVERSGRC